MTEETVTLFLPCDVVRFRVVVEFGPGVSLIEEIVLKALAVCSLSIDELTVLLALPQQVIIDVVRALWRLGHLAVEPGSGKVTISQEAMAAVQADRTAELKGAEREERILDLMIDLLMVQALPPEARRHAPRRQCVDLPRRSPGLADIPITDLWRAADRALRARTDSRTDETLRASRERRVVDVHPEPGHPGRLWRPVLVRPWYEERTGTLGVTVVDPRVPRMLRETASARLTQLVADRPDAPFVEVLREHAVSGTPLVPTAESLANALTERTARLPGISPGQRLGHHEQLIDAAAQLAQEMESRISREIRAEFVTGTRRLQAAADLIERSRLQVVVTASQLGPIALRALKPGLLAALERGVQVVVLQEDGQPPYELVRASGPAPVVLLRQPAHAQVGLIVSDDEAALVLAGTAPDAGDVLGVLLGAPGGGACSAVVAVLSWIRSITPDWRAARAILSRPSGREPDATPLEIVRLDYLPEAPPDGADSAAVGAWIAAWEAYAAGQQEILNTRPQPQARWLTGTDNLELLWLALRTAKRRLVIASPMISDRIVDHRFLAMLRGRLERGVMVTLAYRSADGSSSAALEVLATEFPGNLFLVQSPGGTRALVWDDDALLPAAAPLAADLLTAGIATSRSTLGLRLTGVTIADRIASAAGEQPIVTAQVTGTAIPSARRPELLAQIRILNTAQRIRNRWHEDRSVEKALELLAAEDDPWSVLENLIEEPADDDTQSTLPRNGRKRVIDEAAGDADIAAGAGASVAVSVGQHTGDELVCAATAWCLTNRSDTAHTATIDRWRQWLIHYHWRARQFPQAALLRLALASDIAPRPPLTLVAAAFGTDVSTMALLTALEDEDRVPAENACLLSVAAGELLRTADDDYAEIVGALIPSVNAPWQELGTIVLDYHAAARGIPPELLLQPVADRAARSGRLGAEWEALARAVDLAQRTQPKIINVKRLQVALFKRSGPFGPLELATAHRDADIVRTFLSLHSAFDDSSDDDAVSRIIDEVWGQVTTGAAPLTGVARKTFASRLTAIVAAARTVLMTEEQAYLHQTTATAPAHQEAAHALTKRIRGLSATLDVAVAELGHPEADLAAHALERVSRMTEPEAS